MPPLLKQLTFRLLALPVTLLIITAALYGVTMFSPAEEPPPPEPYGPPPPPAGDTAAKPAAKPDQAPPAEQPEPAKQHPTPIVEFRAASDPVGIRSFDPSGRVAITPQMLVRFFKRRPNDPLSAPATDNSGPLEALPEILVPVEFVPPQPMTTLPSSTATYQLVPKP